MEHDFDKTPSYFNTEEAFEKYLGMTSYYLGLQKCTEKLIRLASPKSVAELGSATGATCIRLAKRFSDVRFVGIDMRADVVAIANSLKENLSNLSFVVGDMTQFVKQPIEEDFLLMLYSYHHIIDPLANKMDFLADAYHNMKKGAYLCIAETFIPDSASGLSDKDAILRLWSTRKDEGFASTFWNALNALDTDSIIKTQAIAEYCGENEYLAGKLVAERNDEFLIQPAWLIEKGKLAGFNVILNQAINSIEDRIILFRK